MHLLVPHSYLYNLRSAFVPYLRHARYHIHSRLPAPRVTHPLSTPVPSPYAFPLVLYLFPHLYIQSL